MQTRREFVAKAALLSGGLGVLTSLPASIQKALAIDPETGSTFMDAEHIVVLMQENRSFDHSYGTLRGVRGFNDPRAITLPNGNPVWLQTNDQNETYGPFRLNLKQSKATWMGCLPHAWTDQVDARNNGHYNRWLDTKKSAQYPHLPLTMGHYTREDIPFYYMLADAFTICDQNYTSSLTGTYPNRLYLMRGTIREDQTALSQALVLNQDTVDMKGTTFPERLQDLNISWKVYQNEIGERTGFERDENAWLSNLRCNVLERFSHFHVHFSPSSRKYLNKVAAELPREIEQLEKAALQDEKSKRVIARKKLELENVLRQVSWYTDENWQALTERERDIHRRAFCTNSGDPDYRTLEKFSYEEGGQRREVEVPKGDILHQFRQDVKSGNLPAVSWLVAPQHFSDHPASPWYGAWYLSETLDILTENPEVWKKTIFILTYDENDGYFDHVPPFVAPHPNRTATGAASKSIDTTVDYVEFDMDKRNKPESESRDSPVGLGYRVPMLIASPWSRGGSVCSQVFDHTSVLQFLEKFLTAKTNKEVHQPEISSWRRAVCGDLTAAFQAYDGKNVSIPFSSMNEHVADIHKSKFKEEPSAFNKMSPEQLLAIRNRKLNSYLPIQEKGLRRSCALPYELYADAVFDAERKTIRILMAAGNTVFGKQSAGSPFTLYSNPGSESMQVRNYAAAAGESVEGSFGPDSIINGKYHFRIDGPNGFMREFKGNHTQAWLNLKVSYQLFGKDKYGHVEISWDAPHEALSLRIQDNAYGNPMINKKTGKRNGKLLVNTQKSYGWYDFSIFINGREDFERRFAGRVESGKPGYSDPAMNI